MVRVEFLNQGPSFASKTHQHGDIDLITGFYHDYLLLIIVPCFHMFSYVFIPILYTEKVNPKPDIHMGIVLCCDVGAG